MEHSAQSGISGEFDAKRRSGETAFTKWSGIQWANLMAHELPSGTDHHHHSTVADNRSSRQSKSLKAVKFDPNLLRDEVLSTVTRTKLQGREVPTLGGIHLLSKIGQGGMGAVYFGIHLRLGQPVAVKVLPDNLAKRDPTAVKRFIREARLAFSVHSPHLVRVMDVNEECGLFFLIMEYVAGQTANALLHDNRLLTGNPLNELVALDICIGATRGLEAAHNNDVIHRDIKPDNILIPYAQHKSSSGKKVNQLSFEHAKLVDLGLARKEMRDKQTVRTNFSLGTPQFMAPEQAQDASAVGKPADVFGMGATLYTLLSGDPPVKNTSYKTALTNTVKYQPLIKLRPNVSEITSALLERCLSPNIEARPMDATALLAELSNAVKSLTQSR